MHIVPSRLDENTLLRLTQIASTAVLTMGLNNSVFHLEARISSDIHNEHDNVYVLEIGARPGFISSVYEALGVDLCRISLALATGVTPQWQTPPAPHTPRYAGNYCITADRMVRFKSIGNAAEILANPLITSLPVFVQPGERVAPAPDGNNYIDFVLGAAKDPVALEAALRWAAGKLEIEFME